MTPRFSRRSFLAWLGRAAAWSIAVAGSPLSKAWATVKRKLLPATTTREALAKMAPPLIDAGQIRSNIEVQSALQQQKFDQYDGKTIGSARLARHDKNQY